jgi:2-polyprenyl-3-methyl-5-hydroxy-6-metoxy-1,4-benzoquinol methylase
MSRFSQRSQEKELMDDLECSGEMLTHTLNELKTINRWLGGNHVTTDGIKSFFDSYPKEEYTVADIGCGGGDIIRVMHDWASKQSSLVKFVGIDANPHIINLAKSRLKDLKNVNLSVQNVFSERFSEEKVDIVTCTLFTHHFTDSELVDLITALKDKSRIGIVINDLHRHPFAYYSIKYLTAIFSKSPMVKNDGPVSVLRAFSRKDWERILKTAGINEFELTWHWAFRWQVLIKS